MSWLDGWINNRKALDYMRLCGLRINSLGLFFLERGKTPQREGTFFRNLKKMVEKR